MVRFGNWYCIVLYFTVLYCGSEPCCSGMRLELDIVLYLSVLHCGSEPGSAGREQSYIRYCTLRYFTVVTMITPSS